MKSKMKKINIEKNTNKYRMNFSEVIYPLAKADGLV